MVTLCTLYTKVYGLVIKIPLVDGHPLKQRMIYTYIFFNFQTWIYVDLKIRDKSKTGPL